MDILKVISIGIITAVCAVILKQIKPELAMFVTIAGSIVIIFLILESISDVFTDYKSLLSNIGLNGNIFTCVMKVIGVGYLVEFAGDICVDAGVGSIAQKLLLAGKIMILVMCMPIIKNLIEIIVQLIP